MADGSRLGRAGGDELVAALARVRPARVFVVVEGQSPREVACGQPRASGRWRRVARLAREIAGDEQAQLELRDARGSVLERVPLTDAPDDDDEASPANHGSLDTRDERILTLVVSAQRAALEEQRVLLGPVLAAYTDLARGYAQYAAQVAELVRVAAQTRLEETSSGSSAADAALVQLVSQLGARPNGASKA